MTQANRGHFDQRIPRCISPLHPIEISAAHGSCIRDADGREYVDLSSGVGALALGYTANQVVDAMRRQLSLFVHSSFNTLPHGPYLQFAEALLAVVSPTLGDARLFFANSGAEAVENAAKLARWHTGRADFIALEGAFHGRTFLALSLTASDVYRRGLGDLGFAVHRLPAPRCELPEVREPIGTQEYLEAIERQILQPERIAGFFFEPVQGEGGVVPISVNFLEAAQQFCRRHGILFIADEIQTGFGRTGSWTTCDLMGLNPDILLLGKAIGGGLPLSAVLARASIMDGLHPGALGTTMGGNALACAAGLAVLDTIRRENLLDRVRDIERTVRHSLADLRGLVADADIRTIGAMCGIELIPHDHAAGKELTASVIAAARTNGALILKAGPYANVIRLLPALNIRDSELVNGLEALKNAIYSSISGLRSR